MTTYQSSKVPASVFVDTEVFVRTQFNFQDSRFYFDTAKFEQRPVALVMPAITALEIERHLEELAEKKADKFRQAIHAASRSQYAMKAIAQLNLNQDSPDRYEEIIRAEMKDGLLSWKNLFTVIELDFDQFSVAQAFNWRQRRDPPFVKKTQEYPDALVLSGLLKHARERGEQIAVISGDGDWIDSCDRQHFPANE